MVARIQAGEADAILVWHPDRLSRNPQDMATIICLMDAGQLKEILTPTQKFINNPMDKFMLGFLMLQAKLENDSTGFLNLGVSIYELSQRAKEIYLTVKAKDMIDEQRALIRFVFGSLTVDEGKLSYTYSKTFKILSEAVAETNGPEVEKISDSEIGKFELTKNHDNSTKKDALCIKRPIWLPREDSNL